MDIIFGIILTYWITKALRSFLGIFALLAIVYLTVCLIWIVLPYVLGIIAVLFFTVLVGNYTGIIETCDECKILLFKSCLTRIGDKRICKRCFPTVYAKAKLNNTDLNEQ